MGIKSITKPFLGLCLLVLLVASVLGCLGFAHWTLDLFSHFRWQYAIGAGSVAILFGCLRRWIWCAVSCGVCAVNVYFIADLRPAVECRAGRHVARVVSFNVLSSNDRYQETLDWLEEQDADVIFLSEINRAWAAALVPLLEKYPHHRVVPRENNFGVAVFSRIPLHNIELLYPAGEDYPVMHFTMGDGGIRFYGVHPPPPIGEVMSAKRDEVLSRMRELAEQGNMVIMGDMNASPWSYAMRTMRAENGLHHRTQYAPTKPTWGRNFLMGTLSIPIDHALCTPDLCLPMYRVGPDLGSDHRPLTIEVHYQISQ